MKKVAERRVTKMHAKDNYQSFKSTCALKMWRQRIADEKQPRRFIYPVWRNANTFIETTELNGMCVQVCTRFSISEKIYTQTQIWSKGLKMDIPIELTVQQFLICIWYGEILCEWFGLLKTLAKIPRWNKKKSMMWYLIGGIHKWFAEKIYVSSDTHVNWLLLFDARNVRHSTTKMFHV